MLGTVVIWEIAVPGAGGSADGSNVNWWRFHLQPYVKNWQVFLCPSGPAIATPSSPATQMTRHYGFNTYVTGVAMGNIQFPAETISIGDCSHWLSSAGGCNLNAFAYPAQERRDTSVPCNANQPNNQTENQTRHNGGSNLCFCDGHAKWMSALAIRGGQGVRVTP